MKIKRFDKKLVLNKKTVADLNDAEMNDLNGGGCSTLYTEHRTCYTFPPYCATDVTCAETCFITCDIC